MKSMRLLFLLFCLSYISISCSSDDNSSDSSDPYKNDNCDRKWTKEIIDAAVQACIETKNTSEVCTCAVETTARELTICETETAEGLARQLEISLDCGVQPNVE